MSPWSLIDDIEQDGLLNMATDTSLLAGCHAGWIRNPIVRLYGWREPTLSLGYLQNIKKDILSEACFRRGVTIVRRPTGGKAILHEKELTYAVIAPISLGQFSGGLMQTHELVSKALLMGLKELGITGECVQGRRRSSRPNGAGNLSPACFSFSNHAEIQVEGKKIIGSAQRRTKNAFLQHGSIKVYDDPEKLHSLLVFKDEEDREKKIQNYLSSTVTLEKLCQGEFSFDDVKRAFIQGFKLFFGENPRAHEVCSDETLMRKKYLDKYKSDPINEILCNPLI